MITEGWGENTDIDIIDSLVFCSSYQYGEQKRANLKYAGGKERESD